MDFSRALLLLQVADLARQWPSLQWLHDAAMKELDPGKLGPPPPPLLQHKNQPIERRVNNGS